MPLARKRKAIRRPYVAVRRRPRWSGPTNLLGMSSDRRIVNPKFVTTLSAGVMGNIPSTAALLNGQCSIGSNLLWNPFATVGTNPNLTSTS